jgi:hypothetical protein
VADAAPASVAAAAAATAPIAAAVPVPATAAPTPQPQREAALPARVKSLRAEIEAFSKAAADEPTMLYAALLVARRHLDNVWRGFENVNEYMDCLCRALTCMIKGHAAIGELTRQAAVNECQRDCWKAGCIYLGEHTAAEVLAEYLRIWAEDDRDRHRDRGRDDDRERNDDREQERERDDDRERERERDDDRERERERDDDRERQRDEDRDREREDNRDEGERPRRPRPYRDERGRYRAP